MKGFPTYKEYLLIHQNGELVEANLKKEYQKLYQKEYNRRRKEKIRITLRLNKKEYETIQSAKQKYLKRSMNKFIIDSSIAYTNNEFLQHDPSALKNLNSSINKIGNNINQIVHKLHLQIFQTEKNNASADFSMETLYRLLDGYEELLKELNLLKQEIKLSLKNPPASILELEWQEVRKDKSKLKQLIDYLQNHYKELS